MARKSLKSQSGAIMLEVIAVLSLMGLMGTMLFRQIYLRNQELHNIQMASEIRVIKDAFAAWIQTNSVRLLSKCGIRDGYVDQCTAFDTGHTLEHEIAQFLPDGYFAGDPAGGAVAGASTYLSDNYSFSLWGYFRGVNGVDQIPTFYGVIVPKPKVLPDGGSGETWNFRRAARVAMLIGIDGGVYGAGITQDEDGDVIAGAVGTWHLLADGIIDACSDADCSSGNNIDTCGDAGNELCPTYVALTGMDVFQPEIELPSVNINLPEHWNLALNQSHVYGSFSAGGAQGDRCYTIGHSNALAGGSVAGQDGITAAGSGSCLPAFYVEEGVDTNGAIGNVRVLNDLSVGYDYVGAGHKSAMRFDKNGMIVFEKATVRDPQTGDDINYLLDPQHTSVMNDIKIMSRGGANLSDILPNYILKTQKEIHCEITAGNSSCNDSNTTTIAKPTDCPEGYRIALVVIPTVFGREGVEKSASVISSGETKTADPVSGHKHSIESLSGTADVIRRQFQVKVSAVGDIGTKENRPNAAADWVVSLGYDNAVDQDEEVHAIAQTYCVFDKDDFAVSDAADCAARGGTYSAGKCSLSISATRTEGLVSICPKLKNKGSCQLEGCNWNDVGNTCTAPAGAGGGN